MEGRLERGDFFVRDRFHPSSLEGGLGRVTNGDLIKIDC